MKRLFFLGMAVVLAGSCTQPSGIETPTLYAPVDNAVVATAYPDFDWSDIDDVSYYQVQVAEASDFLSPTFDVTVYESEFTSFDSLTNDDYWWRVRAWGCAGGS